LDDRGEWYRYHHLFQELLQRQLKARLGPEQIVGLHRRAAAWFEAHGWLEEAIAHALQADDPEAAGHLIVRHRNDILNGEQWHRLERWLNRLPVEVVEADPELLLLKAWHLQLQGFHAEAFSIRERIEERLSGEPPDAAATARLRGGIDAMRSYQHYEKGEVELAAKCAEQTLRRLPLESLSERGYALMVLGGAIRASGDLEGARKVIYDALADSTLPVGTFQGRMLMSLCLMNWVAGDLPSLRLTAKQYFELGEELGLLESAMNGRYFIGIAHYHQNELSKAETSLIHVVSARSVPSLPFLTESAFALASVYQARGQADKARETIDFVCDYLLSVRNPSVLRRAQAYQADLALRQGRMADALRWAQPFDPEPFQAPYRFHEPRITLARMLVMEGSEQSLEQAANLLTRLGAFLEKIHNTRFLIEVLALQALLHDAQGDEPAAREVLGKAVALAQPGGFIRVFVDLGLGLARLLNGLELDTEGLRYVSRILAAYRSEGQTQTGETSDHGLTKRELDILELLANELSNKQIADRLCISPATVKRHTENVYHKLGVSDRRKAVAKATALTIIHS
jgi:LuxR family maltose regulon positive regulatory protein